MTCPDENRLVEFVEGRLGLIAQAALDQHVDACTSCRELLSSFARAHGSGPEADARAPGVRAVGERYVLLEVVGTGAMSVVYAAYDRSLDRKVALKLLRDPDHASASARLRREGQAMAGLAHPNVVPVYDVGTFEDRVYLTAELLPGGTLAEWMRERSGDWRDAVEVFAQAGRGLAAAHRAGVVHRDFKPSNVLLGADGRARVADFGLARRAGDADGADGAGAAERAGGAGAAVVRAADGDVSEIVSLTRTGELVGTPAYMAPEQLAGQPADARSDQYAFAVALHEAVHGRRPYPAETLRELAAQIAAGPPARGTTRIPARLERAIQRGLARAPTGRHASMDAFVAELERALGGPRRRRLVVAAIALVGLATVGGIAAVRTRAPAPCAGAAGGLAGVWDATARAGVERAFLASGHPSAAASFVAVARVLDGYARAWDASRLDACEATHVRRVQSPALLDARTACLGARRAELATFAGALADAPDRTLVARSPDVAGALTPLAACGDALARGDVAPPPPGIRDRVAELQADLGRASGLERLGKFREAAAIVGPIVDGALPLGYAPLVASALYQRAKLEGALGQQAAAEATLVLASGHAATAHDDVLAARIWTHLVEVVGFRLLRHDEGLALARAADASLRRAGSPPLLEANLERIRGIILRERARFDEARAAAARALELYERALPDDEATRGLAIHDLAELDRATGKLDEARAGHERALELRVRALGPDSPVVATSHLNLGHVFLRRGELALARRHYETALAIDERSLPADSAELGNVLTSMGALLLTESKPAEARPYLERAGTAYRASLGPTHPRVGMVENNLGQAARRLGDPDGAVVHFERSIAIKEASLGRRHPEIAASLSNLGDVRYQQGRPKDARALYAEAASILEATEGKDSITLTYPLRGLAAVAIDARDDVTAIGHLERALAIRTKAKVAPLDRASLRDALARALARRGDRARARVEARTAQEEYREAGDAAAADALDGLARRGR